MKASPEWADYVEKIDKMLAGWKDLEAKLDDLQRASNLRCENT
jgi:hypothetical protein